MKGRVAFAKIDVEGHESSVLRGMEATLRHTDCLLVECSDLATDSKEPVLKLAAFFDERGFDSYRVGAECLYRCGAATTILCMMSGATGRT